MKDKVSRRVSSVPHSGIRKFFDLVIGMKDVISLGVGEPDFVTPWHIREAAILSMEKGYTMYTSNYGLLELREEISRHTRDTYQVDYNPENEILITVGVSEAYDLAIRALVDPGDEILIPEPSYVMYGPCTTFSGGKPVFMETRVEDEFKLTPEAVEEKISDKTKAIVLCYPNNPTGAVMNKKELEEIADVVNEHDLVVISDEIYDELTYEGKHTAFSTLNGMRDRTIYLNGFSKAYAMTGWRLGYACGNPELIDPMMKVHQYAMLCAPIMGQMAALEALRRGKKQKDDMISQYNQRRRLIVKRLNEIGLETFTPKGAFYVFPSIKSSGLTSEEFSGQLLKEKNVAVVPGTAFGQSGEGHVRMSYAASIKDINTAMDRIEEFLKSL